MIHLICYDIADPVRLKETAKLLENSGIRLQESVFYVNMQPQEMDKLRSSLLKRIDEEEDSILIYPICGKCEAYMDYIGVPAMSLPEPPYMIL